MRKNLLHFKVQKVQFRLFEVNKVHILRSKCTYFKVQKKFPLVRTKARPAKAKMLPNSPS